MSGNSSWEDLAKILAGSPDTVTRMLARHRPDRKRRCPACTVKGLAVPWPCALYDLATRAAEMGGRQS